jgi:hypothetical protein
MAGAEAQITSSNDYVHGVYQRSEMQAPIPGAGTRIHVEESNNETD